MASKRGGIKANEWLTKLQEQDIMCVGDLRDLQEDDWPGLYFSSDFSGLTVFLARALKNALYGKKARASPKSSMPSVRPSDQK